LREAQWAKAQSQFANGVRISAGIHAAKLKHSLTLGKIFSLGFMVEASFFASVWAISNWHIKRF
jgi:hypothetical protein